MSNRNYTFQHHQLHQQQHQQHHHQQQQNESIAKPVPSPTPAAERYLAAIQLNNNNHNNNTGIHNSNDFEKLQSRNGSTSPIHERLIRSEIFQTRDSASYPQHHLQQYHNHHTNEATSSISSYGDYDEDHCDLDNEHNEQIRITPATTRHDPESNPNDNDTTFRISNTSAIPQGNVFKWENGTNNNIKNGSTTTTSTAGTGTSANTITTTTTQSSNNPYTRKWTPNQWRNFRTAQQHHEEEQSIEGNNSMNGNGNDNDTTASNQGSITESINGRIATSDVSNTNTDLITNKTLDFRRNGTLNWIKEKDQIINCHANISSGSKLQQYKHLPKRQQLQQQLHKYEQSIGGRERQDDCDSLLSQEFSDQKKPLHQQQEDSGSLSGVRRVGKSTFNHANSNFAPSSSPSSPISSVSSSRKWHKKSVVNNDRGWIKSKRQSDCDRSLTPQPADLEMSSVASLKETILIVNPTKARIFHNNNSNNNDKPINEIFASANSHSLKRSSYDSDRVISKEIRPITPTDSVGSIPVKKITSMWIDRVNNANKEGKVMTSKVTKMQRAQPEIINDNIKFSQPLFGRQNQSVSKDSILKSFSQRNVATNDTNVQKPSWGRVKLRSRNRTDTILNSKESESSDMPSTEKKEIIALNRQQVADESVRSSTKLSVSERIKSFSSSKPSEQNRKGKLYSYSNGGRIDSQNVCVQNESVKSINRVVREETGDVRKHPYDHERSIKGEDDTVQITVGTVNDVVTETSISNVDSSRKASKTSDGIEFQSIRSRMRSFNDRERDEKQIKKPQYQFLRSSPARSFNSDKKIGCETIVHVKSIGQCVELDSQHEGGEGNWVSSTPKPSQIKKNKLGSFLTGPAIGDSSLDQSSSLKIAPSPNAFIKTIKNQTFITPIDEENKEQTHTSSTKIKYNEYHKEMEAPKFLSVGKIPKYRNQNGSMKGKRALFEKSGESFNFSLSKNDIDRIEPIQNLNTNERKEEKSPDPPTTIINHGFNDSKIAIDNREKPIVTLMQIQPRHSRETWMVQRTHSDHSLTCTRGQIKETRSSVEVNRGKTFDESGEERLADSDVALHIPTDTSDNIVFKDIRARFESASRDPPHTQIIRQFAPKILSSESKNVLLTKPRTTASTQSNEQKIDIIQTSPTYFRSIEMMEKRMSMSPDISFQKHEEVSSYSGRKLHHRYDDSPQIIVHERMSPQSPPNDIPWGDAESSIVTKNNKVHIDMNEALVNASNDSYHDDDDCDGVTLSPTTSDVSSLSMPTCLHSIETSTEFESSCSSSDEDTGAMESGTDKLSSAKGASEASSSHTSEAATPLIHSALGSMKMTMGRLTGNSDSTLSMDIKQVSGLLGTIPHLYEDSMNKEVLLLHHSQTAVVPGMNHKNLPSCEKDCCGDSDFLPQWEAEFSINNSDDSSSQSQQWEPFIASDNDPFVSSFIQKAAAKDDYSGSSIAISTSADSSSIFSSASSRVYGLQQAIKLKRNSPKGSKDSAKNFQVLTNKIARNHGSNEMKRSLLSGSMDDDFSCDDISYDAQSSQIRMIPLKSDSKDFENRAPVVHRTESFKTKTNLKSGRTHRRFDFNKVRAYQLARRKSFETAKNVNTK